jgi:hypothetical protein
MAVRMIAALGLSLSTAAGIAAQSLRVGDVMEDYLRVLQISGRAGGLGSFAVRPLPAESAEAAVPSVHPWTGRLGGAAVAGGDGALRLTLTTPKLRAFANSRLPVGLNDGVVWQGRGLTTALDVGAVLQWRALTVEVRPTFLYTQNSSHELAPVTVADMPIYAYPWREIDWPQRFGPDPFWTADPGRSEARVDAHGVSVGLGTKNLWRGPAIRNPIIMSNNAPGFPHGFLGTDGPLGTGIGEIEGRWIWGRLQQSDWSDPNAASDDRFVTGVVVTYSPSFVEGLSLGATRLFYYVLVRDDGIPLGTTSCARSTTTTPTTRGRRRRTRRSAATTSPFNGGATRSGSWTTSSSARG